MLGVVGSEAWLTAYRPMEFPARLRPGEQRRFLLDVDTFAAGASEGDSIRVDVEHAPTRWVAIRLSADGAVQVMGGS